METWINTIFVIIKDAIFSLELIKTIPLFLLTAFWLYNINKKLWEKHSWLSWIPIINIYSYFKASWLSIWKAIKYYIIIIISILLIVLIYLIILFKMQSEILIILMMLSFFIVIWVIIIIPLMALSIINKVFLYFIAKRLWKNTITTIWIIVIPFIMLPIIWYKLEKKNEL